MAHNFFIVERVNDSAAGEGLVSEDYSVNWLFLDVTPGKELLVGVA